MSKNKTVKGVIGIKDEVSSVLNNVKKSQASFRDDVKKTKSALADCYEKTWKTKIDDNVAYQKISKIKSKISGIKNEVKVRFSIIDQATAKVDKIKNKLNLLRKTIVRPMVQLKDATTTKLRTVKKSIIALGMLVATPVLYLKNKASQTIQSVKNGFELLKSKIPKPVIEAVDKTKSVLGSIGSKLAGMAKKLIIPVTVAATVVTAGIGASVKSGMELEQQQISIKHFIGATNKDMNQSAVDKAAKEFTQQLRDNANATPFETGEVIQAGSRAISLTQGNRKEAMSLVKLAEDMAAASGGTASIQDAIEALGDAKMGEMERLKSFGFKVSADEFKQKGFAGVSKDLEDFFGGASAKLATSGSGLMSTITGKLKSSVSDFGIKIVDQIKPVMTNMISLIDKAMPYIDKIGTSFGKSLGKGINIVSAAMPDIIAGFQSMQPLFITLITGIQSAMPPIMAFAGTVITVIQSVLTTATPVIQTIVTSIAQILPVLQPIFSTVVTSIGNIINSVLPLISPAIEGIKNVIITLAPIVQTTFETIGVVVSNVIDGITGVISGGLDLISNIWSGNWQGVVDAFGTIFGGIGEICKAPINAVIGIINAAIDGINSIAVDVPDWIPGIGGQHWGLDLGHIPFLAKGGIVDKPTPAIFGEAGKEAVVPLEHNTGWMDPVISKILQGYKATRQPSSPINLGSFAVFENIKSSIDTLIGIMQRTNVRNTTDPRSESPSKGQSKKVKIVIEKIADNIYVHKEEDIDEVGEALVKKLQEIIDNS